MQQRVGGRREYISNFVGTPLAGDLFAAPIVGTPLAGVLFAAPIVGTPLAGDLFAAPIGTPLAGVPFAAPIVGTPLAGVLFAIAIVGTPLAGVPYGLFRSDIIIIIHPTNEVSINIVPFVEIFLLTSKNSFIIGTLPYFPHMLIALFANFQPLYGNQGFICI